MEVLYGIGLQVRWSGVGLRTVRMHILQRGRRTLACALRHRRAPRNGCTARIIRHGLLWCGRDPYWRNWLWRWMGWNHGCCPDPFFAWEVPRTKAHERPGLGRCRPQVLFHLRLWVRRFPFEAEPPEMRLYYKVPAQVPRGMVSGRRLVHPREWTLVPDEVLENCTVRISRCGRFWVVSGWM